MNEDMFKSQGRDNLQKCQPSFYDSETDEKKGNQKNQKNDSNRRR